MTRFGWFVVTCGVLVIALAIFGGLWYLGEKNAPVVPDEPVVEAPAQTTVTTETIGTSVEGRPIVVHTFGSGDSADTGRHLLFVGGIHGGYEWNSVLLAYAFIDHFTEQPSVIPESTTVTIIPSLNPDGVFNLIQKEGRFTAVDVPATPESETGFARFNANNVDLNRNFDCKWQPESTWKGETVSAGANAFSEPEAQALRDFVLETHPDAVVFWHSKANAVYASECENGILPATVDVMNAYATAGGYSAIDTFDAYAVTGDAEGWLASIGIPAITVELETRNSIEWDRNLRGVEAVLGM